MLRVNVKGTLMIGHLSIRWRLEEVSGHLWEIDRGWLGEILGKGFFILY